VASTYDGTPGLVSDDQHATYVVIRLKALDDSGKRAEYDAIKAQLKAPGLTTQIGGTVAVGDRIDALTKTDVSRGEMIAMPVVLVLLILIFGGVVAASLPLLVGVLAVLGALTVTRLITVVTDVSTFAVNAITLLGLGMAIDYSLLMINRFRDEVRSGRRADQAVARTPRVGGAHGPGLWPARHSVAFQPADLPRGLPTVDGAGRDGGRPSGDGQRVDRASRAVGHAGRSDRCAASAHSVARPHVSTHGCPRVGSWCLGRAGA
jgi:hypothetical protein